MCPGPYRFLPTRGGEVPVRDQPWKGSSDTSLGRCGVPDQIIRRVCEFVCSAFSERPKITRFSRLSLHQAQQHIPQVRDTGACRKSGGAACVGAACASVCHSRRSVSLTDFLPGTPCAGDL